MSLVLHAGELLSGGSGSGFSRFPVRGQFRTVVRFPPWRVSVCLKARNLCYVLDYGGEGMGRDGVGSVVRELISIWPSEF